MKLVHLDCPDPPLHRIGLFLRAAGPASGSRLVAVGQSGDKLHPPGRRTDRADPVHLQPQVLTITRNLLGRVPLIYMRKKSQFQCFDSYTVLDISMW